MALSATVKTREYNAGPDSKSSKQFIWFLLVLQLTEKERRAESELVGFCVQLPNFLCTCKDWRSRGGEVCVSQLHTSYPERCVMLSLPLSVRLHSVFIVLHCALSIVRKILK